MESREIEAGTRILIGAPASPMPRAQSAAIADVLAKVAGVVEAHLPQVFAPGAMREPAQVLVVVTSPETDAEALMHDITCRLAQLLTEDSRLDVFPVASDSGILRDVRAANCQILGATPHRSKSRWNCWGG